MKAHVIQNGIIVNTIEVDSLDFLPNLIDAASGKIGDGYVDGIIVPHTPAVPVPQSVTNRQAKLALHAAGLLSTVNTAIAGAGEAAQIEWEYAQTVDRASGLVPQMATALGMTSAQIDALFVAAAVL